jgi:hypothetical protein
MNQLSGATDTQKMLFCWEVQVVGGRGVRKLKNIRYFRILRLMK